MEPASILELYARRDDRIRLTGLANKGLVTTGTVRPRSAIRL